MLSLVQAHTHGVNWELWIALITPVSGLIVGFTKWLGAKLKSLDEKLISNLADINGKLDDQDKSKYEFEKESTRQHKELGERVARIEGPVAQVAKAVASE